MPLLGGGESLHFNDDLSFLHIHGLHDKRVAAGQNLQRNSSQLIKQVLADPDVGRRLLRPAGQLKSPIAPVGRALWPLSPARAGVVDPKPSGLEGAARTAGLVDVDEGQRKCAEEINQQCYRPLRSFRLFQDLLEREERQKALYYFSASTLGSMQARC